MKNVRRYMGMFMGAAALAGLVCGCGGEEVEKPDPGHPVTLKIWHYYNGSQQESFRDLVEEFNDTAGREQGIYVRPMSKGDMEGLEKAIGDSLAGKVGSEEMPDMFSAYADTAYRLEQQGNLANLSDYLTEEELAEYVDSYMEEGRIAEDGGLRIFPVAKATEVLMMNRTVWDTFAAETGASEGDLATIEGIVRLSEQYYNWTDAMTPDIEGDGRAFYGRDSMANYFIIGMRQQGTEIFQVENGRVTVNDDKEQIRRLWDNYYVPYIKGYFASYGSFRSDDVKTGDLVAYTGSTASAMYFPDQVDLDGEGVPATCSVMPAPMLEGGEPYVILQGAGIAVMKSDKIKEYAAVEFLKWMTRTENNLRFGCQAGYLPVRKDANDKDRLNEMTEEDGLDGYDKILACFNTVYEQKSHTEEYVCRSFAGAADARGVLEQSLSDRAAEDRERVMEALEEGSSLEEACQPFLGDEAFDAWYEEFDRALREAVF